MNIITIFYYWIIRRPRPKFKISDVVSIKSELKHQLVDENIDLDSMKMMVVLENKWNRKTGYIVDVDACNTFSHTQQIHEDWLQLMKLN